MQVRVRVNTWTECCWLNVAVRSLLLATGLARKQETCLTVLLAIANIDFSRAPFLYKYFCCPPSHFLFFTSLLPLSLLLKIPKFHHTSPPSTYQFFVYFFCIQHSTYSKMAAAVMSPMSSLSLDREIMPPSPVSQNFSRHGRSRHGGSVVKGKARGRGYSIVDDREVMISKALTWVLKRTVQEDEEQEEGEEKLVADAEGWVDCEEVVRVSLPPLSNTHI